MADFARRNARPTRYVSAGGCAFSWSSHKGSYANILRIQRTENTPKKFNHNMSQNLNMFKLTNVASIPTIPVMVELYQYYVHSYVPFKSI
jgi:hypothetical protein